MRIGALEGGGSNMILAIVTESGEILDRKTIPTEAPEVIVPEMVRYFKEQKPNALGIGFFGPLQLNPKAPNYGSLFNTPKPAWKGFKLLEAFQKEMYIPIGIDTRVNASVLAEVSYGRAQGLENCVYMTIGNGIGMGVYTNGKLVHGMQHPEGGHMLMKPHPEDSYAGNCPYHGCCLEGMASGPAIEDRWKEKPYNLDNNDKVWEFEAYYIAQGLVNVILQQSPEKIILGGGVMKQVKLLSLIRKETARQLAGYIETPQTANMDDYIVLSSLGENVGILGSAKIGMLALQEAWGSLS